MCGQMGPEAEAGPKKEVGKSKAPMDAVLPTSSQKWRTLLT